MIKVTIWILFLAIGSYGLFCLVLYTKQRSMLYYPTLPTRSDDADVFWLTNGGESLKVWRVKRSGDRSLLYFGGNAEDVALNIPKFTLLFPNHSLFFHNYRGYGGSSGRPTEQALFSDALALYDEVAKQNRSVVVVGRSLGTATAVYLASQRKIVKLILITPFDSMVRLASSYYPFIPVAPLLKDRFESISYAAGIDIPTLIVIAEHDEVVPRKNSDALVAALDQSITEVTLIPDTSHNTIESHLHYDEVLTEFVRDTGSR